MQRFLLGMHCFLFVSVACGSFPDDKRSPQTRTNNPYSFQVCAFISSQGGTRGGFIPAQVSRIACTQPMVTGSTQVAAEQSRLYGDASKDHAVGRRLRKVCQKRRPDFSQVSVPIVGQGGTREGFVSAQVSRVACTQPIVASSAQLPVEQSRLYGEVFTDRVAGKKLGKAYLQGRPIPVDATTREPVLSCLQKLFTEGTGH